MANYTIQYWDGDDVDLEYDDAKHTYMVDGSMYWLGIRDMVSKAGKEYKKVRVNPITENYTARAREGEQASADDIPF